MPAVGALEHALHRHVLAHVPNARGPLHAHGGIVGAARPQPVGRGATERRRGSWSARNSRSRPQASMMMLVQRSPRHDGTASSSLPFTRIFENLKKNLSGEPFEKNFEKSQREEGEIPRFRGYNPPEPRNPQSRKPAEVIISDARSAHTLHTVNQCTPRTPVPA